MIQTIAKGINKGFLCKIRLHKWGKWLRHSIISSNVVDIERKCKRCRQAQRKTIPRDFPFGYED